MSRLPSDQTASDGDIAAFLDKVRTTPAPLRGAATGAGRLIFAMDATASRKPMWDRACSIQGEMFEAAAELGGLQVQLVFYRGLGECKASRWTGDAKGLGRLMTGVDCLGGRTQIGKVLRHAAAETARRGRCAALVFVGDSFEEDIDEVCHDAGELGLLGLPVFLFQEGRDPLAERAFREIAKLTGGAWAPFDAASAEQMKALLRAVAVYAAGGRQALLAHAERAGGAMLAIADQMRTRR